MKKEKYAVRITEILQRVVIVEAEEKSEAISLVKQAYRNADIVLDYSDFDGYPEIECAGVIDEGV